MIIYDCSNLDTLNSRLNNVKERFTVAQDFNTLTTPGCYIFDVINNVNAPEDTRGFLYVSPIFEGGVKSLLQRYITILGGTYERMLWYDTWTNWSGFALSSDLNEKVSSFTAPAKIQIHVPSLILYRSINSQATYSGAVMVSAYSGNRIPSILNICGTNNLPYTISGNNDAGYTVDITAPEVIQLTVIGNASVV